MTSQRISNILHLGDRDSIEIGKARLIFFLSACENISVKNDTFKKTILILNSGVLETAL